MGHHHHAVGLGDGGDLLSPGDAPAEAQVRADIIHAAPGQQALELVQGEKRSPVAMGT